MRRIIEGDQFNVSVSEPSQSFLLNKERHGRTSELIIIDAGSSSSVEDDDLDIIRQDFPDAKIVILHDAFNFDFMVDAFGSGVDGYIIKDITFEPLLESLRLVAMGEKIMPSALAQLLPECRKSLHEAVPAKRITDLLSDREIDTLRCICNGDPNKVIARRLEISEATVKVHVKAILRKLHLRNRTEAVAWTLNSGIDLSPAEAKPALPAPPVAANAALALPAPLAA